MIKTTHLKSGLISTCPNEKSPQAQKAWGLSFYQSSFIFIKTRRKIDRLTTIA